MNRRNLLKGLALLPLLPYIPREKRIDYAEALEKRSLEQWVEVRVRPKLPWKVGTKITDSDGISSLIKGHFEENGREYSIISYPKI